MPAFTKADWIGISKRHFKPDAQRHNFGPAKHTPIPPPATLLRKRTPARVELPVLRPVFGFPTCRSTGISFKIHASFSTPDHGSAPRRRNLKIAPVRFHLARAPSNLMAAPFYRRPPVTHPTLKRSLWQIETYLFGKFC